MRTLVVALAALLAAPAFAADYTLADLEALEKQGGWEELVEHLADVPPSKRDAAWNGVAERGCAALLASEKVDAKSADQLLARIDKMLRRFPTLKTSKSFMAQRAEIGLKAFGATFHQTRHSAGDDPWMDALKDFVKADTVTADLPVRAAKRVQQNLTGYVAWPFWKQALEKDAKGELCKDPDFQKSILGCFEDGMWKDEIQAPGAKCWNELKPHAMAMFEKSERKATREALCPLLKAKKVKAPKCDEEDD